MLDADNTAVSSDEMDGDIPSTDKNKASLVLNGQDQPSPPTVGAVHAFSTAEEDYFNDAAYPKKVAPYESDELSLMNFRGFRDESFVAKPSGGVGGSRCNDGGGMEDGALAFGSASVADDAANMAGYSSGLDGSNSASGSSIDENLGVVTSSMGGLGVEISDSSLARGSSGSEAIGVEGGDVVNFCASSSSSSCSSSVAVDAGTSEVAGGGSGVCVDTGELPSRGVPNCWDGVRARAGLDVADKMGSKVVRDAAAGFDAVKAGATGVDVAEEAGTMDDPIQEYPAVYCDDIDTVDSVEGMVVDYPSSSIDEVGLEIDCSKISEAVADDAGIAVALAANCDKDHVTSIEEGKHVVGRGTIQVGNVANIELSASISGKGNSGDGVFGGSQDGSEGDLLKSGSVRDAVGDDAISSVTRVCETGDCVEHEGQALEPEPEIIPSIFPVEKSLSSVAPKSRPWGLPDRTSVPPPRLSGGAVAVDEAFEAVSESILKGSIEVSSVGLEIDGADEDYDSLVPEEVSPVMDRVSVVSKDSHKRMPDVVGKTPSPPPTEENKRTAGTVVRKAVAVIAAATYYGVWAAITIVLG